MEDLNALGMTPAQIVSAAQNAQVLDGTTASTVTMASVQGGPGLVADVFADHPGIQALGDQGGNRIFIRPGYFNYIGNGFAPAVMFHEGVHNATNMNDPQVQTALGLPTNQPSFNITIKLLADCVMQSGG